MAGQIKKAGYNQEDLVDLLRRMRNTAQSAAGTLPNLAPATNTDNLKTLNATIATVDGVQVHIAAVDPLIVTDGQGLVNTAADQSTVVLVQTNSAGTVSLKQGPVVAGHANDTIASVPVPVPDAGVAVIGFILIKGTAHTWGTTALTAGMLFDGDPYLRPSINKAGYGQVGLES